MTELEATQRAVLELGQQATVPAIVSYVSERFGLQLDRRFVPVYLATLRGQEERQRMRTFAKTPQ
jgi:hypothetical protein